uniref:aspartate ammonia-lyase n=1 Tax=Aquiluna sp. TaxID=2053504 RepID=UPI00404768C3
MTKTRIEHDLIGDIAVPAEALWGVHTARAVENFPITGVGIGHYRNLIKAMGLVKAAAAKANGVAGVISQEKADLIYRASMDVAHGLLDNQFVVDAIQGGAGTSTNMNANEVIANRALQIIGKNFGDYEAIHPINDVNASQSTNDVYPTALKIALIFEMQELIRSLTTLENAYRTKAREFSDVIKMGRTQLQDAVPMTLGQTFEAYAITTGDDVDRLHQVIELMTEINLGGTAIGTRINASAKYVTEVCTVLSELTGVKLRTAENLVEATQDTGVFVRCSNALRVVAVKQSKISNDLRLLSSGPRAGFNEINLPAKQAGSSIMPGKVNPVIPEVMNQIAFTVIGNDLTVALAAEAGQLELNAFEPVIARSLMMSIGYLKRGCATLTDNCVLGITANRELLRQTVENSIGLVTALSPKIGYEKSTEVAKVAQANNASVKDTVIALGYMTLEEFDAVLGDLEALTGPETISLEEI